MENFQKAVQRDRHAWEKFPQISEAKIKDGIFVGPQIRELHQFDELLRGDEKAAWKSFKEVCG